MADDEEEEPEETPTSKGEGLDFLKGSGLAEQPKWMTTIFYVAAIGFLVLYLIGGWQAGSIHLRNLNSFFDGGAYTFLFGLIILGSGVGMVFGNKSQYAVVGQAYFALSFVATIFLEGTGLMEIMILFIFGGVAFKGIIYMLKPQADRYVNAIRSSTSLDEASWKANKEKRKDDYNAALGAQKKAINSIEDNLKDLRKSLSVTYDLGAVEKQGYTPQHTTMSTTLNMGDKDHPAAEYRYEDTITDTKLERLAHPEAVGAVEAILIKIKEGASEAKDGGPKELGSWILDSWPVVIRATNELYEAAITLHWEELKVKNTKLKYTKKKDRDDDAVMEIYKRYTKGASALKIIQDIFSSINSLSNSFYTQADVLQFVGAPFDFSHVKMYRTGITGAAAPGHYQTDNYMREQAQAGNHLVTGDPLKQTTALGTTLGTVIKNTSAQLKAYIKALNANQGVKKHDRGNALYWPKALIKETYMKWDTTISTPAWVNEDEVASIRIVGDSTPHGGGQNMQTLADEIEVKLRA